MYIKSGQLLPKGFENAPILMPLIPGYKDKNMESEGNVTSQLDAGVSREIAPQIVSIIRDAQRIVEECTGVKVNDEVIAYGHSKSATFANNFAMLHPEMVKAIMLGGHGESIGVPIEQIRLRIVEEHEKSGNEQFEIIDIPVRKVTKSEFEEIKVEYETTKKETQQDISENEDGTYSLPMNYPLGIADIEDYIDLSQFPGGKSGYIEAFSKIPRMMFVGEREEAVTGHFAYSDGQTIDGTVVKAGQDVEPLQKNGPLYEIEYASMHNRVLEYISASRILFGKSVDEKLRSYMQLCDKLKLQIQSKIYKGVGHTDIYKSSELRNDITQYYEGILSGDVPALGDDGRAKEIDPIDQLIRRYELLGTAEEYSKEECERKEKYIKDISEDILKQAVEELLANLPNERNLNRNKRLDLLTQEDLQYCFDVRAIEILQERGGQQTKGMVALAKNALAVGETADSDVKDIDSETKEREEDTQEKQGVELDD